MSPAFSPFIIILPNFHLVCIPSQPWSLLHLVVVWIHLISCSVFHHFVSDSKIPSWVSFCQPRQVKFFALTPVRQDLSSLCSSSVSVLFEFAFLENEWLLLYTVCQKWSNSVRVVLSRWSLFCLITSLGIIFTSWSNVCLFCGCITTTLWSAVTHRISFSIPTGETHSCMQKFLWVSKHMELLFHWIFSVALLIKPVRSFP